MRLLRKPFGEVVPEASGSVDEAIQALHAEFCSTFRHQPGVSFMEALRAGRVTRLIRWLDPSTPCAIPKGFVRLAVESVRRESPIWAMPGISMNYEGNWDNGGLPPKESMNALSVLAQVLRKPIKLYYRPQPGADLMVAEFQP